MRVLVCGSRDHPDELFVWNELSKLANQLNNPASNLTIIHGAAKGVDTYAGRWADICGVKQEPFPADWKKYGKAAGPIRNSQMLVKGDPDLVIAFPWPNLTATKGTKDMVKQARAAGVRAIVFGE